MRVLYAENLFELQTVENFFSIYKVILSQITNLETVSSQLIKELNYLDHENYIKLALKSDQNDSTFAQHKLIHELVEEQAEKSPHSLAVVAGNVQLTYKQLNEAANQLAAYLRQEFKIKGDDLIPLYLDRSEFTIIAILGVLKSGAAYVPVDPAFPTERVEYILKSINSKVILTNSIYETYLTHSLSKYVGNEFSLPVILVLDSPVVDFTTQPTANLPTTIDSTNLCYVIFTSGTTGKPKGVMLEHIGCVNRIFEMQRYNQMAATDRVLFKTNYVFDVSFSDIFVTLGSGACLYVTSAIFDLDEINHVIIDNQITLCHFTPSQFEVVKLQCSVEKWSTIRVLNYSGEELLPDALANYLNNNVFGVNYYGPTETGEVSCAFLYPGLQYRSQVTIGRAFRNIKLYILNEQQHLLPFGAIGELYVGGICLARGYLNAPQLTQERFIANPFQTEVEREQGINTRLYKTGDLVRYLADGNIEYLGRNDFQVKIRGYRIELGEIESRLASYPNVRQAAVLAREHKTISGSTQTAISNNKYLVAYYVADTQLNEGDILSYLAKHLPEYMLPSIVVWMDKFPLTINGKLDHKALPEPELSDADSYIAPRNDLEQQVCSVYAEVLGLDVGKVGIHDDFFRLGGDSLLSIKLVSKLNKMLNSKYELTNRMSVLLILKHKTIAGLLAAIIASDDELSVISKLSYTEAEIAQGLDKKSILSFAQERLWFIESYEGGSNAYNIPLVVKLSKECNLNYLIHSLAAIVERHKILRSLIKTDINGSGYQEVIDFDSNLIESLKFDTIAQVQKLVTQEVNHVFKLQDECPIRIKLIGVTKTGELYSIEDSNSELVIKETQLFESAKRTSVAVDETYLCVVVHHIAFDGWSIDILFHELNCYYSYYSQLAKDKQDNTNNAILNLPELSIQYQDFAVWQRAYLSGERLEQQLNYWSNKLSDYTSLNLITDTLRPAQICYVGDDVSFSIDKETSCKLRALAKTMKVSLYSVLLSGFNLFLNSYTNQSDIVIGTPVANRHHPQLEQVIGFFVNTLVLRSIINKEDSLANYIREVGTEIIEAQLHQDLPFEKLVDKLDVIKDQSRHPIFQVMFGVQSFGISPSTSGQSQQDTLHRLIDYAKDDLSSTGLDELPDDFQSLYKVAKFDLTVMIDDSQDELVGTFNYATSLYTQDTISRFTKTYSYILQQLSNYQYQEKQLKELSYIKEAEYKQQIYTWNETQADYPRDKTIHQLFEEQVERTPDNIAVVYESVHLTYRELNRRANQLAHYLRDTYQIKGDDLIALHIDRSEYMLVAMLAILKAGAGYVPMDPSYPDERISFILADTQAKVVIANQEYTNKLNTILLEREGQEQLVYNVDESLIAIDSSKFQTILSVQAISNPRLSNTSTNLAYVIYTSGTTGKPKGVMIEHSGVVNVVQSQSKIFNLSPLNLQDSLAYKSCLQYANYVFDASVSEIFTAIINGHQLHILSDGKRYDIELLSYYIAQNHIYIGTIPPMLLDQHKILNLKTLVVAGDKTDKLIMDAYSNNGVKVINAYGPTEATICATFKYYADSVLNNNIGSPIANTKAYILNDDLSPLPVGAVGELYIGGMGLARGYLNRLDLTEERFIANPFQTEAEREQGINTRLYKTGDLVRYLADGNIEYLGRNDFQVKIRGYRIELGEIESRLASYPNVRQVAVLAREHKTISGSTQTAISNNKYLVAYYVADIQLNEGDVLNYLAKHLPEYMLPSIVVWMDKFPLTINGKLDHKALPEPELSDADSYVGDFHSFCVNRIFGGSRITM